MAVRVVLAPRINFACHQNAVPVLRELSLSNASETPLTDVTLEALAEPAFLSPKTWHFDRLGPGDAARNTDLDLTLSAGFLWDLTEAVRGSVNFELRTGDELVTTASFDVELLARSEWGGIEPLPEMIAAFVTPNDPAVEGILKRAAAALQKSDLPPQIDGYQSGSAQRAGQLAAAIWLAVGALGIDYATPAASFELGGQKVRSPTQVCESGLGTCLDLTVLFAACLEQAGLHPLIVFTQGHAFVGCWLRDEQFASVVVDDVTSLRKRLQLRDLCFFETTLATAHPAARFGAAIQAASRQLAETNDERFHLAIDVHRARMQRIRPLPTHRPEAGQGPGTQAQSGHGGADGDLDLDEFAGLPDEGDGAQAPSIAPETPRGRLDRWQRKLLDLSLRNRLLNFKSSKRSLALRCADPALLEDKLADGQKIKILPSPRMMDEAQGRSEQIHRQRFDEDAEAAYAETALRRNEVLADLEPQELDARLVGLYRTARASLQEGGANTLFLALGFLVWNKGGARDARRLRAPLILVPVSLERKSVRSGVRLVRHDDESRVNPTLLQMLEQDFALRVPELAGPLPVDESGLDVRGIWQAVTRAVQDHPGWEVAEDVVLGHFSFVKYLMWKDLVDRTAALKHSPVVRHLIDTPKEGYVSDVAFPAPKRLDHDYPPEAVFTPLPADSSQLSAVMAAAAGKDFVLVGPPGTGKSQTIANIIAQCLAQGRTVLFVSEKTAALDVVYRRLREVGLGSFCLELHSSKARKLDVLEQLRAAWQSHATLDAQTWQREAERLAGLRESLNRFVERLHHPYPNGLMPYQAIGQVLAGRDVPAISLSWASPDAHERPVYEALVDIAERMDVDSAELGRIADSPFAAIARAEWSPSWQRSLVEAARSMRAALSEYAQALERFASASALTDVPVSAQAQVALVDLAALLPQAHGQPYGFCLAPDAPRVLDELKQALALLERRHAEVDRLSCTYRAEALRTLDVASLREIWSASQASGWPRSALRRRRVRKVLRAATQAGASPHAAADLAVLEAIRALDAQLRDHDALSASTEQLWAGVDTDGAAAQRAIDFAHRLRAATASLATTPEELAGLRSNLQRLLVEGNELLADGASVARAAASLHSTHAALRDKLADLGALAGSEAGGLTEAVADDWLAALDGLLEVWVAQAPRLRAWCAWRRVRDEAMAGALAPLVEAVEAGTIAPGEAKQALEVNYARWWINAVVDGDEVLRAFVPAEHERTIQEFVRLDDAFTQLTQACIRARLCGQLPGQGDVGRNSEWGVLKRELEKKRRHKPLRQLVEEMPTALTRLTPCLLMSPLSIAQYLPADHAVFDVVIFDEASQIPVWDAVGAIARGRQAVIVGDPKQLPPTSFFERADDPDDYDADTEKDLESILDECLGASLPALNLSWHYRSRHESLIAFSNHRYYGGSLVTFPSPVTRDRAVSYHRVPDGVYEKGGARTNQREAKALVADIIGRLGDPAFAAQSLSIGVVTFNTEQQRLIEDLFDAERRRDPRLERWFSDDALEPIMVKNLESVQGDERDIIHFSVTYGPDAAGRVSMNFGPLNRDGGERRLNVAITRARQELRVFATLHADQINLARTQALGVRDFKHFLEYAERGPKALAQASAPAGTDFESPFEQSVAAALAGRGWQIHPQVGVSQFRIDLAVVDPDAQGRYLAGVECDGATYHRAATARDRDKLREAVLRGLGWEVLRVWSTDWWTDPEGALEKLDSRLQALLSVQRAARQEAEVQSRTPSPSPEAETTEATSPPQEPDFVLTPTAEPMRDLFAQTGAPGRYAEHRADKVTQQTPGSERAGAQDSAIVPYEEVNLQALMGEALDPERFYDDSYTAQLQHMISAIVGTEGPVRDERLIRNIARAHGFQRAGRRIQQRIQQIADEACQVTEEPVGKFYWPADTDPRTWSVFRSGPTSSPRAVDEIAREELSVLAGTCAQGADREARVRAMANACGIHRVTVGVRSRLEGVIDACGYAQHVEDSEGGAS